MGRFIRLVLVFLLVVNALAALSWQPAFAQTEEREYFEETGHSVSGPFLQKYHSVPNPLELYGYPITEAFRPPKENVTVQYFQKARFELSDDALPGEMAQASTLGKYLYKAGHPNANFGGSTACRPVVSTAFRICYAFLEFFDANGGVRQFGLPISNAEDHDGRIVQYFERARFEWHPDRPSGKRVTLSDLGAQFFYFSKVNQAHLLPVPADEIIDTVEILSLRVRAAPQKAIASRQGFQTVTIIVRDQRLMPVENAQVTMLVTMPDGTRYRYIIPTQTNERGIVQFQFPYKTQDTGPVQILVTATYQNLKGQTTTSFRAWW